MRRLLIFMALAMLAPAQNYVRWSATTGDISLSAAGTTATVQQPSSGDGEVTIDLVTVYCSVACNVTQAANGTGATTTAGTVQAILPTQLNLPSPVNFFTASNVGTGTAQGGTVRVLAGVQQNICLSSFCGASGNVQLPRTGINSNWSITISAITGTANITYYLRTQ
jgi:hypothetical protein